MFDGLVEWLAGTEFYLKYMSQWPAPINNVSFDAMILLALLVFAIYQIRVAVKNMNYKNAIAQRKHEKMLDDMDREKREAARQEREREREERRERREDARMERDDLMQQYMQFLMTAQMQNMTSCIGMSFDQFKDMKNKVEEKESENSAPKIVEKEVVKEVPVEVIKEVVKEVPVEVVKEDPLAYTDELTGLGNRRAFNKAFENAVESCMAVVYADINGLKTVNDTLGHSEGDRLITTVANALKIVFADNVFRIGGDEFVAVLNIKADKRVAELVDAFKTRISNCNLEETSGVRFDTACGYCVSEKGLSKADIQRIAEERMYADKAAMRDAMSTVPEEEEEEAPVVIVEEENEEPAAVVQDFGWTIDEESPEFLDPAPLIELDDEPQETPSFELDVEEEAEEPELELEVNPVIDLDSIVSEKQGESSNEAFSDEQQMDEFTRCLNMLKEKTQTENEINRYDEEKSRVKENNIKALEKQVKSELKVEGIINKGKTQIKIEDTDFDARREKALKLEEKQRLKAEKIAERERKKAEKIAARANKKK